MSDTYALVKVGATIEHNLVPGFRMTVIATRPCETDANRSVAHEAYEIVDMEGNRDWLCAADVHEVA
jgi:hypothetical protein